MNWLWKKKIKQPVLGQISQIDIYKNGRLQLIFNTRNKIYVLDRNGNNVKQFPKTFNDPITQPLSVFDYDNNKNYRLLVTQGSELLMYDKNGKKVNGFKYKKSNNSITSKPKHFRILNKEVADKVECAFRLKLPAETDGSGHGSGRFRRARNVNLSLIHI